MVCKSCCADSLSEFRAEICVHFPGPKGLDIPAVFVYPNVVVCLHCGLMECVVPEAQLQQLAKRNSTTP